MGIWKQWHVRKNCTDLKYRKMILNIKASTPNYMIYGDLDRYPVVELGIRIRITIFG